ncbi:tetratricopeptide repeat protein [Dongia mobilis]|uniref:tetratricopeptide repeat protein n=1 Tax=Dongia sp. TaxID=1977262 RepID=UPI0026EF2CEC
MTDDNSETAIPEHLKSIEPAMVAIGEGRLEDASRICAEIVAADPLDADAVHLLGVIGFQGGAAPEQALDLIDRAIALDPARAQFQNSRGALLYALGRNAEAEVNFRSATILKPDDGMAWNNLGNALLRLDRVEEAEGCFRQALVMPPILVAAINNLGIAVKRRGQFDKAMICFREAVLHDPTFVDAHFNLGEILYQLDQMPEAEACFREAVRLDPKCAPAYASLAQALHDQSRPDDAMEVIRAGLAELPEDEDLAFALRLQLSSMVPAWHIPMINDDERNIAYSEALARAIRPGDTVFEIGTGSGIIAMMAARAGAGRVVTCEVLPVMADAAREIVVRNGYGDRITVINKKSTQLRLGEDLPERADIFVSELINVGMLAPNMLSIIRHARENLVKPEGRIIPEAATIYGALLQCDHLARINPVGSIAGFDMSGMDQFRSPGYAQIDLAADPHQKLSDRFVALSFDFRTDMKEVDSHRLTVTVTVTEAGLCHGVAFWFDLHLFDGIVFHSDSPARTNHWKQAMHFFATPIPVQPGDELTLVAGYDNTRIFFNLIG